MRFLLDTQVIVWWHIDPAQVSPRVTEIVQDRRNDVFWSMASAMEIAIKTSLGKLDVGEPLDRFFPNLRRAGFLPLEVNDDHCVELSRLPWHHRDPFDRLLVAQARVQGIPILSIDEKLRAYDVEVVW